MGSFATWLDSRVAFFFRGYLPSKIGMDHQSNKLQDAYFPRRDTPSSQDRFHATQLRQGCISRTLQRTRRALQAKQAFLARVRGRSGLRVAIIAYSESAVSLQWVKMVALARIQDARFSRLYATGECGGVGFFGYMRRSSIID